MPSCLLWISSSFYPLSSLFLKCHSFLHAGTICNIILCLCIGSQIEEVLRQRVVARGQAEAGQRPGSRSNSPEWCNHGPELVLLVLALETWLLACQRRVGLLRTSSRLQNSQVINVNWNGQFNVTVIQTRLFLSASFPLGTKWEAPYNHKIAWSARSVRYTV